MPKLSTGSNLIRFPFIALLCLLVLNGCGKSESNAGKASQAEAEEGPKSTLTLTPDQVSSIGVKTVSVAEHNVGVPVELPGQVIPKPDQEAYVTSLIPGRIEQVKVNEGDHVQKGEQLVTITGANLGTLIADLQNSWLEYKRQQRLMDRGVGIESQLQDARIAYTSVRQQLRAIGFRAEEMDELAAGEQILDAIPLRAPISGVVLERKAVAGGPVADGDKLFYLANLTPVWIHADAYEGDLEKIKAGQPAQVTTSVNPGRTYSGSIKQIVPKIKTDSRTASVILELPNRQEELRPGMFASITVQTDTAQKPAVPAEAVQVDGELRFVLIAENDSTFRRQEIPVTAEGAPFIAVPDIPLGTKVVTRGAFQITSAMKGVEAEDE